jgi:Flp pilus assembly protein TadD
LGRHSEAVVAARRATELSPDSSAMLSALGHALASDGRMAEARAVLRTLDDLAEFQPVQAGHRALVLVGLGECEAALAETRRACEQRSRFAAFLGVWPVFDSLRGDPRYIDLLHLIRIPSSAASRATVS